MRGSLLFVDFENRVSCVIINVKPKVKLFFTFVWLQEVNSITIQSSVRDLADTASIESSCVAGTAEEQLASMEQISKAASAFNGIVQDLLDNLSRFKI